MESRSAIRKSPAPDRRSGRRLCPGFPRRLWAQPCPAARDRKSTRLNSSHSQISYAVFCLKKKTPELTAVDASSRTSFPRPAPLASSLEHPNVCTVSDLILVQRDVFLVMHIFAVQTDDVLV